MIKVALSCLLLSAFALSGCAGGNHALNARLQKIDKMPSLNGRLAALVQLDQSHPHEFEVKFRLGELYLQLGDPQVAVAYLGQAASLGSRGGVPREQAKTAQLEYARTLILVGRPAEAAAAVAPLAKRGDPAALLVQARASVQQGDAVGAVREFAAAWSTKGVVLDAVDYTLYAEALSSQKKYDEALKILRTGAQRFGYQPGTGYLESSLLEKLGKTIESILAAFKETEYQRTQGAITTAQIEKNLRSLAVRSDVPDMVSVQAQTLIRGLEAYLGSKWGEALSDFGRSIAASDDAFARYLVLSATFENGRVTARGLGDYVALEPAFRTYPDFYYYLWKAMRKGPGSYTFDNAKGVLEKVILLAPRSEEGIESRVELGRLIGLGVDESKKLLIPPEVDAIYAQLLAGGDPGNVLGPVLGLLSIPKENIFTDGGALMLRSAAASVPAVRAYLTADKRSASGALEERLAQVL